MFIRAGTFIKINMKIREQFDVGLNTLLWHFCPYLVVLQYIFYELSTAEHNLDLQA